jgi:hypothetical protein
MTNIYVELLGRYEAQVRRRLLAVHTDGRAVFGTYKDLAFSTAQDAGSRLESSAMTVSLDLAVARTA